MKDFQERSSFSTWLARIAINSALMILRKKRIRSEISIDSTDDPVGNFQTWEPKSHWEDSENGYIRRERQKLLRHAIHQLPAVFRDVVQLRHARECSGQEIAQSLGITVPAVKSRLVRAERALHTSLLQTDSQSPS
jgi:RNA polymerase sigma-70 factor (ECF subfamily)